MKLFRVHIELHSEVDYYVAADDARAAEILGEDAFDHRGCAEPSVESSAVEIGPATAVRHDREAVIGVDGLPDLTVGEFFAYAADAAARCPHMREAPCPRCAEAAGQRSLFDIPARGIVDAGSI